MHCPLPGGQQQDMTAQMPPPLGGQQQDMTARTLHPLGDQQLGMTVRMPRPLGDGQLEGTTAQMLHLPGVLLLLLLLLVWHRPGRWVATASVPTHRQGALVLTCPLPKDPTQGMTAGLLLPPGQHADT
jgi:hypothetical protein